MIDVRRAGDRFTTTTTDRLTSRHSFSFGAHYDPSDIGLASLVAHNEDFVAVGAGYDTHPHTDTEIVTWVLDGSLVHEDSRGHSGVLGPGVVQVLGAGSGVRHSERNDAPGAAVPTRFVQMWLRPDESGLDPAFARGQVPEGPLVALASGIRGVDAAVRIRVSGAALLLARLAAGESVGLPDAPHVHVFVARGTVDLEGAGRLTEGDAARLTGSGGARLQGVRPAEVLVWQLP